MLPAMVTSMLLNLELSYLHDILSPFDHAVLHVKSTILNKIAGSILFGSAFFSFFFLLKKKKNQFENIEKSAFLNCKQRDVFLKDTRFDKL